MTLAPHRRVKVLWGALEYQLTWERPVSYHKMGALHVC